MPLRPATRYWDSATKQLRPVVGVADILDLILLAAGAWLLFWVAWSCLAQRPQTSDAVALLITNGILAWLGFAIALRGRFPIMLTCFYFDFLFLAVAPIQQLGLNFDPVFSYEGELSTAAILCVISTLFGLLALIVCTHPRPLPRHRPGFFRRTSFAPYFYPLVLWITACAATIGVLAVNGPHLFASRDALSDFLTNSFEKSGSLLFTSFLAPFAFIATVIGLRGAVTKADRHWIIAFAVVLAAASLVSVNPSILPRFRVSALLAFALLATFGWNNTRAIALFFVGGVVISPLLNAFRTDSSFSAAVRPFDTFFAHLDFDSFSLIVHVIHYVRENGYSYGSNIIAGLLFFVPRALWPEKSEHVGYYIFSQIRYYRNVWTDNVSSPPVAEGYFALGAIGALLFCACVWAGFVLLERAARSAERDSPLQLMACLTPIYAIMILRGPFIVGYSELWGNYTALFLALAVLQLRMTVLPPSRPISGQ